MTVTIFLLLGLVVRLFCGAVGENRVAIGLSSVKFKCKTAVAPIWYEKIKSISMAYGVEKRTTFKNDRYL